jgi:competence protein ComEC
VLLGATFACAPRVTPPDPWKGVPTPRESATPVAQWSPPAATPGPSAAGTAIASATPTPADTSAAPCGEFAEGPAPIGAKIHTIRFLDVGQGDSALVTTASGKTILIDAGDREPTGRILADLRAAGAEKIDLLMASHPHLDHIGGMRLVIDALPVRLYVDPGTEHTTDTYRDLMLAIEARKIPHQVLRAGKNIKIGDEATLSVFSPPETLLKSARSVENANSLVVRLSMGTFDVLFTGDAEPETLESLISTGALGGNSIEVLKVAHHGSRYGTSRAFIDELHPKVAVISVGDHNDYHHPHPETLQILAQDCVRTYRTDRDGIVTVKTDGTGFRVSAAKGTPVNLALPGDAPARPSTTESGSVYASKTGKTYHPAGCFHLNRVNEADRREFHSAEEAEQGGLRRASGCKPAANASAPPGVEKLRPGARTATTGAVWKGAVVASSRGKVYHPAGCPHIDKIKEENRVEYPSAAEAEAAGLRAGSGCRAGAN